MPCLDPGVVVSGGQQDGWGITKEDFPAVRFNKRWPNVSICHNAVAPLNEFSLVNLPDDLLPWEIQYNERTGKWQEVEV